MVTAPDLALIPGWVASMWLIVGIVLMVAWAAAAVPGNPEGDVDPEDYANGLATVEEVDQ